MRALGVIDLPTIQRKVNLHFSLTLDLFGSEISTNAANAFNAGLKGRYREDKLTDDHQLLDDTYPVLRLRDGAIVREDVPALSSLNMRLRDDFVADARGGRARAGTACSRTCRRRLSAPPAARRVQSADRRVRAGEGRPGGQVAGRGGVGGATGKIPADGRRCRVSRQSDGAGAASAVQYAGWIAPPRVGIDNKPGDFGSIRIE